jgi:hypothetical protein
MNGSETPPPDAFAGPGFFFESGAFPESGGVD